MSKSAVFLVELFGERLGKVRVPLETSELRVGVSATVPPKRYRVGELAEHTGLTRQTVHNYTKWGLIHPIAQTGGGQRLYDESAFERLARIRTLKQSYSIARIRGMLESSGD